MLSSSKMTLSGNSTSAMLKPSGNGGVYINNTGALEIGAINAATGNVELAATGGITDDTQMTLFTAEAVIRGINRSRVHGEWSIVDDDR